MRKLCLCKRGKSEYLPLRLP